MKDLRIIIPEKIHVGFQNRGGDNMGFVTFSEGSKLRKEVGFNNWIDKKIQVQTLENVPREGFKIFGLTKRSSDWFGSGSHFWYVQHPDGWYFEISSTNLYNIIAHESIEAGVFTGKWVIAFSGANLALVSENSELYKQAYVNAERKSKKVTPSELSVGTTYLMHDGIELKYLGKYYVALSESKYIGSYRSSDNVKRICETEGFNIPEAWATSYRQSLTSGSYNVYSQSVAHCFYNESRKMLEWIATPKVSSVVKETKILNPKEFINEKHKPYNGYIYQTDLLGDDFGRLGRKTVIKFSESKFKIELNHVAGKMKTGKVKPVDNFMKAFKGILGSYRFGEMLTPEESKDSDNIFHLYRYDLQSVGISYSKTVKSDGIAWIDYTEAIIDFEPTRFFKSFYDNGKYIKRCEMVLHLPFTNRQTTVLFIHNDKRDKILSLKFVLPEIQNDMFKLDSKSDINSKLEELHNYISGIQNSDIKHFEIS